MLKKLIKRIKAEPIYIYIFFFFVFLIISSFFRDASADEAYYLRETVLIAELIKKGIWIGNYGVGLHGFLFKIPVAILFVIIGKPSIFIATLFTISLSIISLVIFYKIVKEYFFKGRYAFLATVLLSVMFHFINTSISFNRDVPAILTVLIFFYFFLRNANKWVIGLSLLLMLDAKEHVFLTIAPMYGIYQFISNFIIVKGRLEWQNFKNFLSKSFSGYIFSLIWIILMFTTSLVPVNMFIASITGLTSIGQEWNKSQFSTEVASQNLMEGMEKEIPKISELPPISKICVNDKEIYEKLERESKRKLTSYESVVLCKEVDMIDIILGYIGKILYPRTFSFISVPKIIVLPAIIHSIYLFISWFKRKDKKYVLPIILIFNILIVILRASHGRYLLSVVPLFVIFFILFLRDGLKKPKYFKNVLLATTIFVLLGLLFESTFVLPKIILEFSLLALIWIIWILRKGSDRLQNYAKTIFLVALVSGMFLTALMFSYKIGQLSSYIKYGNNRETNKIVMKFNNEEKIWINDYGSGDLINVYRKNLYNEPEWYWKLADWLPKKNLLRTYKENNTFAYEILDMEKFKEYIKDNSITKVVLVISTIQNDPFSEENRLGDIRNEDWLKFEQTVELKNKVMYIFKVEN